MTPDELKKIIRIACRAYSGMIFRIKLATIFAILALAPLITTIKFEETGWSRFPASTLLSFIVFLLLALLSIIGSRVCKKQIRKASEELKEISAIIIRPQNDGKRTFRVMFDHPGKEHLFFTWLPPRHYIAVFNKIDLVYSVALN